MRSPSLKDVGPIVWPSLLLNNEKPGLVSQILEHTIDRWSKRSAVCALMLVLPFVDGGVFFLTQCLRTFSPERLFVGRMYQPLENSIYQTTQRLPFHTDWVKSQRIVWNLAREQTIRDQYLHPFVQLPVWSTNYIKKNLFTDTLLLNFNWNSLEICTVLLEIVEWYD